MEFEESHFVKHIPCDVCGSSDANSLYSDGHTHCHKCGAHTSADGALSTTTTQRTSNEVQIRLKGEPQSLPKRGISAATCKKGACYLSGGTLRFYYKDRCGVITGAKVRDAAKNFSFEGINPDKQFYLQNLWPATGKRVVIFEGEFDALSGMEAMPNWPMVSIPHGAGAAKKAVQAQLEWLQGYEEIVLFFDKDSEGQKAAEECASILPPGKAKIAKLADPYKDASDALQANDSQAIRVAIWNAESWTPGGIVDGRNLLSLITTELPKSLYDYPFSGLQEKLLGIRPRELVTITAGSGIGKSSLCRQLATYMLQQGERVGYIALEESNQRSALGLMGVAEARAFHMGNVSLDEIKDAYEKTLKNWNLFLFDGFGSYDPDVIYNRIEYLALGLDVRVIFLDHLSILLSGMDGDERRMIDVTMTRLRSLVERTGISMFLVCHLSGSVEGGSYEEGGRVKLTNLRGSKSIGQLSDAVIALERNQQEEGTDAQIRILKNRFTGLVGPAGKIRYNLQTNRYEEVDPDEGLEDVLYD